MSPHDKSLNDTPVVTVNSVSPETISDFPSAPKAAQAPDLRLARTVPPHSNSVLQGSPRTNRYSAACTTITNELRDAAAGLSPGIRSVNAGSPPAPHQSPSGGRGRLPLQSVLDQENAIGRALRWTAESPRVEFTLGTAWSDRAC
jgi:hypothetical protein